MTTLYAFDGAGPFDLQAAKNAGAVLVTGYVVGNPGGFGPITKTRVNQIRSMGMGFWPNWERAADAFLTMSVQQCQQSGTEAAAACAALGLPADGSVSVPFSIDTQVPVSRYPEMWEKLDAAEAGMRGAFQARCYGQAGLLRFLNQPGRWPGRKHWLSASTFGMPYNPADPSVCVVQSHTGALGPGVRPVWLDLKVPGTDSNTVTDPYAVWAWWPDGSIYRRSGMTGFGFGTQQQADQVWQVVSYLGAALMVNGSPNLRKQGEFGEVLRAMYDKPIGPQLGALLTAVGNVPTVDKIAAAIKVSLTPQQVQDLAAALAPHLPINPVYTGTLTPQSQPPATP